MNQFLNPRLTGRRLAILLHGGVNSRQGKTGLAFMRYSGATVVAAIDHETAGGNFATLTGIDRTVPIVPSFQAALAYQPDTLLIGIAPSGGALPAAWVEELSQAINAGCSIINGLHAPLARNPDLTTDLGPGQWIWDLRREPLGLRIGAGRARGLACRRVLTVGTDMAVGKMSAGLELTQTARDRGLATAFIATGQAGLAIVGTGVALDAVRVDFAAGAVEAAVLDHGATADIAIIEGQGSLLHPGSTATLPLIRGSQPTHLILVHRAGQTHLHNVPDVPIPDLPAVIQVYEAVARAGGAFPGAIVAGVALNTGHLSPAEAATAIAETEATTGLPCTDVVRYGGQKLLDAILAHPEPSAVTA